MSAALIRSPARLWLVVFALGFTVIAALLTVTVLTPVPYGDLSRIGLVSESEFGWKLAQPEVPAAELQSAPLAEADVLVLGDSFSMSRHWQSVLVRDGLRVATADWGQFGNAVCQDIDAWLAASGFHGKLMIIESVERTLAKRAAASASCEHMGPAHAIVQGAPVHTFKGALSGIAGNWNAQLMSGLRTWWNTRRAVKARGDVHVAAEARVRSVPDGCERFSHHLCSKALFFDDDVTNGELAARDVENMLAVTRSIHVPVLWMVVPNKTTVYLEPTHSHEFVDQLAAAGLGPNLFTFARTQRLAVRDFYFPNDTHLSTQGELAVGERMREAVRDRLARTGR